MHRRKGRLGSRAAAVFLVFGFLMSFGVAVYADPNGKGNPPASAGPHGSGNPDSNGKGPDRSNGEDGDHNQGGHCDGNEGKKKNCNEPGPNDVVGGLGQGNNGNGNGNGNGGNGNGNGNGENPDCRAGPHRSCGEEDGDHNQGGACDGNNGNRPKTDCDDDDDGDDPDDRRQISLEKSGPVEAGPGDEITYTFEVSNAGKAALPQVRLTDSMLGIARDIRTLTPPGTPHDSITVSATYVVPESVGDTLVNTAEVCGGPPPHRVCDTDTHAVAISRPGDEDVPDIEITKTVNVASANPGDTLTFTYEVHNAGDTALTDVAVDDDVIGEIVDGETLDAGESLKVDKDFSVANDSPTQNTATACGTDPDGTEVCDTAVASFELTLPSGPQAAPGEGGGKLPRTGFSLLLWLAGGLNLVATGLAMMFRRRWSMA